MFCFPKYAKVYHLAMAEDTGHAQPLFIILHEQFAFSKLLFYDTNMNNRFEPH